MVSCKQWFVGCCFRVLPSNREKVYTATAAQVLTLRPIYKKKPTPPASVLRLKRTSWYMSDHYICLQYLWFLSQIFRLCWLWRNRELVWDIVHGKFSKQLLSVFFLPNEVISYVYKGQNICSVLVNMQNHEVVQSRVSRCWAQIRLPPP